MQLTSGRIAVDDLADAQEAYHSRGWTDGLPVVPPTVDAVAACLEWAMLPPDHLIGIEPVRARAITAEKAAVNAVMAGCLPPHFPVVVTALTAMLEPEFGLHGPTASTGGCAVLLIVNGPIRHELAMDATFSVLGGADRSRAVIGRAVRLVLTNVLDVKTWRHRPLDAGPPRQARLLHRRGRGSNRVGVVGRPASRHHDRGTRHRCRR